VPGKSHPLSGRKPKPVAKIRGEKREGVPHPTFHR
jgi:hypothetical protein